ncbi:hypothetical protein [Acidiphilium sp. C61]|uniref:hypothetical protein n=1 Tax=Acidiphilium sp. C61 TaxID=1671485 RepID=UPI00157A9513|nr:hypothetical protein [Acidiphilium sp. C61]
MVFDLTTALGAGTVSGSTLSVNGNASLAQATGNIASANNLTVTGTNLVDASQTAAAPTTAPVSYNGTTASVNTGFSVVNTQTASATVSATQSQTGADLSLGGSGAVSNATLQAQGNNFNAAATTNSASNNLVVGTAATPVAVLTSSVGGLNVQNITSGGGTSATIGNAGSPAVTSTTGLTGSYTGSTISTTSNTLSVPAGQTISFSTTGTGLTPAQLASNFGVWYRYCHYSAAP